MKDSELKQYEVNEILAAFRRAQVTFDQDLALGGAGRFLEEREAMDEETRMRSDIDLVDRYEQIGTALKNAGEGEIADQYFRHPSQLWHLKGYLPR